MSKFGERLKVLREAAGWSQPALAEKSGVPVGTIRDYEQGRREPLLETAAKLARCLGHSLDSFLEPPAPTKKDPDVIKPPPAKRKGKRK